MRAKPSLNIINKLKLIFYFEQRFLGAEIIALMHIYVYIVT
jgi:hypothetical protein